MWLELLQQIIGGNVRSLARAISLIENETEGYEQLMKALPTNNKSKIIGITGPPGAGKSTLVNGLIAGLNKEGYKIAVLCVDPSSPFNLGAVLGDRIRMSEWHSNPNVFIRSLATRGSLGGLHPKAIELSDLLKAAGYDFILVETVGIGQTEVEIAALADTTIVVLVPESGDEIQTMKAGLMEIADLFVINKSDRPGADSLVQYLNQMLAAAYNKDQEIQVLKTEAVTGKGLEELVQALKNSSFHSNVLKREWLLTEKASALIRAQRMKGIDKERIKSVIKAVSKNESFNLYQVVHQFLAEERPQEANKF